MLIRINSRRFLWRFSVTAGLALAWLISSNAFADAVDDMCADADEVCKCAASQLKTDLGERDYALYESIGAAYLDNKSQGMNMVEAWDAAVKAESDRRGQSFSDTLKRTNTIGSTHRDVITTCRG